METFDQIRQYLKGVGIELFFFIAGLFGAIVNVSRDKKLSFLEKVISILSGGLIATYLSPLLIELAHPGENTKYGIAFILGYMGLKGVELIINFIKSKLEKRK